MQGEYTRKMVLSLTLLSFLLSGCSGHMPSLDSSSLAVASPTPSCWETSQELNPAEDVQNLKEMQLVMLFQGSDSDGSASPPYDYGQAEPKSYCLLFAKAWTKEV